MKIKRDQVVFISPYPPRECGLSIFTQDLIDAFKGMFDKTFDVKVCALQEDQHIKRMYPPEVVAELNMDYPEQCLSVANDINNNSQVIAVVIEHEFNSFKGGYGEHIFHLLNEIRKPIFICLHTVIADPDEKMLKVVSKIAAKTEKIIVLTSQAKEVLQSVYHIASSQVMMIPYGIHLVKPVVNRSAVKEKYGLSGKIILCTFGLINSNKAIETALEAISALPDKKNILYLILGKTHPDAQQKEGEKYREYLINLTRELQIEENVLFINKFLDVKELHTYLKLTDIYLFTSRNSNQTVSGTLTYAKAAGCVVVATPIPHAREIVKEGNGYLFDFGNSDQLKNILKEVTGTPQKMSGPFINTCRKATDNSWETVANQFAMLFKKYLKAGNKLEYNLPSLNLEHFCKLTTLNGILQSSHMWDPDLSGGYTTNDQARALYMLTMYNELHLNDPLVLKYFDIYLNFLERAIQPDGSFLNDMNKDGEFIKQDHPGNPDEVNTRAFVSICRLIQSDNVPDELKFRGFKLLAQCSKYIYTIRSPRSMAKTIKGLYFLDQFKKDPVNSIYIHLFSSELLRLYNEVATPEWEWFESYLTHDNSAMPEALMYAYLATNDSAYRKVALKSFRFLLSKIFAEDRIRVISHHSPIKKGESYSHQYGERPIEVASVIEALSIFYQATGEPCFKKYMQTAFSWFLGNNHLNRMIYNPINGGCHDGADEFEVNINQGAESVLSHIISLLTMDKLTKQEYFLSELFAFSGNKFVHHN